MDEEAKRAREQTKNLPFKKKLSNYWEYYKYHTIVVVCCIIALGLTLVQCVRKIDYDMNVSMYVTGAVSDDDVLKLTELLKKQCIDVTDDNEVNVYISQNAVDITAEIMDEMAQAIVLKLQAEVATSTVSAYIVDEAYKNLMIENYDYPAEDVAELSTVHNIGEILNLKEDQKLYWLTGFRRKIDDKLDHLDNAKRINQYLMN